MVVLGNTCGAAAAMISSFSVLPRGVGPSAKLSISRWICWMRRDDRSFLAAVTILVDLYQMIRCWHCFLSLLLMLPLISDNDFKGGGWGTTYTTYLVDRFSRHRYPNRWRISLSCFRLLSCSNILSFRVTSPFQCSSCLRQYNRAPFIDTFLELQNGTPH